MVEHPILLRGLDEVSDSPRPTILQRTDQELIPALLEQLEAANGLQALRKTVADTRNPNGVLQLFQPVQRMFAIVLFEAVCLEPGLPRLDPDAIDSAGLVVRRERQNGAQGWLSQSSSLRGWVSLQSGQVEHDPDPTRRKSLTSGNGVVDRALALQLSITAPMSEQVTPLFVAPPELCAALGKTILYGISPTTSSEFSEAPTEDGEPLGSSYRNAVASHMPRYLRAGAQPAFPLAGRTISSAAAAPDLLKNDANLSTFVDIVRQIALEFDAFGESSEAKSLFAELNTVLLPLSGGSQQAMGDFFKRCSIVLLDGSSNQSVVMPTSWPTLSANKASRILDLIVASLGAKIIESDQGERRFEDPTARYHLRGFVRVQREANCPPELVWSPPSESFTIAPWYASVDNGLPLPQIALPDPFDRDALRNLKPNVAFKVPEKLFGLVNGDMTKVIDGEKPSAGSGFGLDWLCSFSIPIITICAFLVLNIFLSLFDIIFRWLLFIKICIPIPKKV